MRDTITITKTYTHSSSTEASQPVSRLSDFTLDERIHACKLKSVLTKKLTSNPPFFVSWRVSDVQMTCTLEA